MTTDHVRRLLAGYAPGRGEEESLAEFVRLLVSDAPVSRRQFQPGHYTASGFVLSPDRSAVLLIRHRRLGRWMQPGGHIDPDDLDIRSAAAREIAEEAGVVALEDLTDGLLAIAHHPIPSRHDEPRHRHFDLKFGFIAVSADLDPSDEVMGAAWVSFDHIARFGVDDETRRGVEKLRSLSRVPGHG